MLVNAGEIPPESVLEADVCIVGAGIAGLAMAGALGRKGVRTLVLESGGEELPELLAMRSWQLIQADELRGGVDAAQRLIELPSATSTIELMIGSDSSPAIDRR